MNKGDKVKFKESVTIKDLKQFTNVNLKKNSGVFIYYKR